MKKYLTWEYTTRTMKVIEFFVIVVGVFLAVYQLSDILNNQLSRKDSLALTYFDRLNQGSNGRIVRAVGENTFSVRDFAEHEIDSFLNDLDGIGYRLNRDLLDPEIVCTDFSDIAISAYENTQIKEYVASARRSDASYFGDFDDLYLFVTTKCKFAAETIE